MAGKTARKRTSPALFTAALLVFAGPSGAGGQTNAPVAPLKIYLDGFHASKNDTTRQMEAHHFCHQMNPDFMQCALFDGNTADAHLIGIEYIISEKLFESLPAKEQQYWHPHNFEILSGQLVTPGLSSTAEHKIMAGKMNSYGKTWQVWDTGNFKHEGDKLPLGEPALMWSFNHLGEEVPGLVESRDKRLGTDTQKARRSRQDLVPEANPQAGVDVLPDYFPGPAKPIPGVRSKSAGHVKGESTQ